jgi:short subunit dehydrogenase-like uncharacterized protein
VRSVAERDYDIVVFGATGFTGALTADYLARNAPATTRWALAGRNPQKLDAMRAKLAEINPKLAEMPLLQANADDPVSLRNVAEATKVVITTVGPYILYGEPLVAACAAAGTDYVDLTGEPEFVDRMWLAYHAQAEQTGARIVHSCGFDSIPYDLGTLFTVEHLPEDVPLEVTCFVRMGGTFSGGTFHSAIHAMSRLRENYRTARERKQKEPRPTSRRVKGVAGRPHRHPEEGWVVPFPTIDPQTVLRSARMLDRYGPDFTYSHYLVLRRLSVLVGGTVAVGGAIALAQLPPTRRVLLKIKDPGEGPTAEEREKAWFRVGFVGEGGGQRVQTQVSGGDPGYGETSKMLAESALCLAHDELPELAGQLTTAVAMGQPLIDRLGRAGIKFEVVP